MWRSRIVGRDEVDPATLQANPANWRTHPRAQREALADVLDQVGFVQDVIVNKRSGRLVDGHLRLSLALERGEPTLPVLYVDLDDDEERLILATFDPLSAAAGIDGEALGALLGELQLVEAEALASLLDDLYANAGLIPEMPLEAGDPPTADRERDSDLGSTYLCPECGHEWSGNPR